MAHLLVIDDEESISWALSKLAAEMGHTVTALASAEAGIAAASQQRPDAVMIDVRLPGMDGLEAMSQLRPLIGEAPVMVMTAYGDLETAVEAVREGAFEYLVKPFSLDVAQCAIERALAPRPPRQCERSVEEVAEGIVGRSASMQELFKQIALVAASEACTHLFGESGTGKELVARAIHRYSRRADGPFVPVNIGSLSPSLAESELFGHVQGAFTGAERPKTGLLERAEGGTVFLDEVADIPSSLQVKLLRAIELGEIWPVGASRPKQIDFRLISATHSDLRTQVAEGSFRHDLYYRLVTFTVSIPPLRERLDDLDLLVQHFSAQISRGLGLDQPIFGASILKELRQRPWHGNVRELRNVIEHAIILARNGPVAVEHLPPPTPSTETFGGPEQSIKRLLQQWSQQQMARGESDLNLHSQFLRLAEPTILTAAMQAAGNQYRAAANLLGMHRTTLRKKLDEHGIGESL